MRGIGFSQVSVRTTVGKLTIGVAKPEKTMEGTTNRNAPEQRMLLSRAD